MNKTFFIAIISLLHTFFSVAKDRTKTSNALLETLVKDGFAIGASASYSVNGDIT